MKAAFPCAFLVLLVACASSPGHGKEEENRDVLTREEMVETDLLSLEEVVHRLRPEWFLRARGGGRLVVFDADLQVTGMGLADFHDWKEAGVYELEFLSEKEALEALSKDPRTMYRKAGGGIIIRVRLPRPVP